MKNPVERLRAHPAFASLRPDQLTLLLGSGGLAAFDADEVLLVEGEESDSALFVMDGTVLVEVASRYGSVAVATLPAPAFLGEIGVFAEAPRTATVRAVSPGWALRIPGAVMRQVGTANPELTQHVVMQLGRKVKQFNQAIGFYTNALAALEDERRDVGILDDLMNPPAELTNFALTFSKMADQIRARRARLEEMESAAAIQGAMLPAAPFLPSEERVAIDVGFRPARDVGGDFYDVLRLDENRIALTVGDVSGKGVPASLFMAICQTAMRLVLREERDLGRVASRVNDFLDADNARSMFATFFGAVLDLSDGSLTFVNCGHNPPFLLRGDGRLERLGDAMPAPALAAWSPFDFEATRVDLAPGDRLLIFTDGVTEAPDATGEEFGEDRLAALFAGDGAPLKAASVIEAVDAFTGAGPQFDDLTCLLAAYRPAG